MFYSPLMVHLFYLDVCRHCRDVGVQLSIVANALDYSCRGASVCLESASTDAVLTKECDFPARPNISKDKKW